MPALHYLVEFKHIQNDISDNNFDTEAGITAILQNANLRCEETRFSEGAENYWLWNFFGIDFQFRTIYKEGDNRVTADLFIWKKDFKPGALFTQCKKFLGARDFFIMEMKR